MNYRGKVFQKFKISVQLLVLGSECINNHGQQVHNQGEWETGQAEQIERSCTVADAE